MAPEARKIMIMSWPLEFSEFDFGMLFRRNNLNTAPDAHSGAYRAGA